MQPGYIGEEIEIYRYSTKLPLAGVTLVALLALGRHIHPFARAGIANEDDSPWTGAV